MPTRNFRQYVYIIIGGFTCCLALYNFLQKNAKMVANVQSNYGHSTNHISSHESQSDNTLTSTEIDVNDEFLHDNVLNVFIRGVYHDNINKSVTVLAISRDDMKITCHFDLSMPSVLALTSWKPPFDPPHCDWVPFVIKCPIGLAKPTRVSFSLVNGSPARKTEWYKVHPLERKEKPEDPGHNTTVAVCSYLMYDKTADEDVMLFIEYMELSRLLGISKILLYDYFNVSPAMVKAIQHYVSLDWLQIIPWDLPYPNFGLNLRVLNYTVWKEMNPGSIVNGKRIYRSVECIPHGAHYLAFTHCYLKFGNLYTYLQVADMDEFVVPLKHATLPEFLETLDSNRSHFIFRERRIMINGTTKYPELQLTNNYQYLKKTSPYHKSIINPKYVQHMGIHHPELTSQGHQNLTVRRSDAMIFHYRRIKYARKMDTVQFMKGGKKLDTTMQKYHKQLEENIKSAYRTIEPFS